jgi:hypothetical protein
MVSVEVRADRIQRKADELVAVQGRDYNFDIAKAKAFVDAAVVAVNQGKVEDAIDYLIDARNLFDCYNVDLRNQVGRFLDFVLQK